MCYLFQPPPVHGAASDTVLQVSGAPTRAAEGSAHRAGCHDRIHLLDVGNHRREERIISNLLCLQSSSRSKIPSMNRV